MIAHVNGIDLFYEKTGEGRPLVMVHGNSEDHTIFNEAVDILKDRFTCYCPDSRSHGQSTKVGELHYDDMAEDFIYGFSDGGIIGILAAAKCDRITTLITSGANLTPNGAKPALRLLGRTIYLFTKDPKMALMLREPWIGDDVLHSIKAKTLVLAGSKDLVTEKETRQIAAGIPGAELRILEGEGHGSYIVHKTKIGEIIRDFAAE